MHLLRRILLTATASALLGPGSAGAAPPPELRVLIPPSPATRHVVTDPSGFVVAFGDRSTVVHDLRAGTTRELPNPEARCDRIAAGSGQVLWRCEDGPRLADLRTGEAIPAPPGAAEIEQSAEPDSGGSYESVTDVDGPVGARWIGFTVSYRDTTTTSFLERATGRVHVPELRRGEVLDLDEAGLRRRMCRPIRPRSSAVLAAGGYDAPHAAWLSTFDAERVRRVEAQRCGERRVRRLGTCPPVALCEPPVVRRGWAAWHVPRGVRAVDLRRGRRYAVAGASLVGLAGGWLVVRDRHGVRVAPLRR